MPEERTPIKPKPPRVLAVILFLFGIYLFGGGVWLLSLGGSFYYAPVGLAVLIAGAYLWFANPLGATVFQIATAATVLWAIWESGFDLWGITPRVAIFLLLTVWLYMPWVRRALDQETGANDDGEGGVSVSAKAIAAVAIAALGGAAIFGATQIQAQEGTRQAGHSRDAGDGDWRQLGNSLRGSRYSELAMINEDNVGDLAEIWRYQSGDAPRDSDAGSFAFAATPIEIGDTLYFCTPHRSVIALDADTGEERWRFDPEITSPVTPASCAGVAYYENMGANGVCARRIYSVTADARLVALDAANGNPCPAFGNAGFVDLTEGIGAPAAGRFYQVSPPTIVGTHVIVGGGAGPDHSNEAPSGVVRSFDARNGRMEWAWDIGRQTDGAFSQGTPATSAPFAADPEIGLVYVATGSPPLVTDGTGLRGFDQRYANSVVALEAGSGQVRWSFQTTHSDVWDYGLEAQPVLVDLLAPEGLRRALVQATKHGNIFVLDRTDGTPMSQFVETPAPLGQGLPFAKTQPRSEISFAPERLQESDMWGLSPFDQLACRIKFRSARYEGPFTPPGATPALIYPGRMGAIGAGGIAIDQRNKLIVANTSLLASYDRMVRDADGHYTKVSEPFLGPLGLPCNEPPWGMMQVFDLKTTDPVWSTETMRASLGGPLVTEGALIFQAGTTDGMIRAYHLYTGEEVWSASLPAGGQAAPMTYETSAGRQFLVVAAGGSEALGTETGDYLVAYAISQD